MPDHAPSMRATWKMEAWVGQLKKRCQGKANKRQQRANKSRLLLISRTSKSPLLTTSHPLIKGTSQSPSPQIHNYKLSRIANTPSLTFPPPQLSDLSFAAHFYFFSSKMHCSTAFSQAATSPAALPTISGTRHVSTLHSSSSSSSSSRSLLIPSKPINLRFCGLRREAFGFSSSSFTGCSNSQRVQLPTRRRFKGSNVSASLGDNGIPKSFDYDLIIIGAGVGGHGAALHAVEKVRITQSEALIWCFVCYF